MSKQGDESTRPRAVNRLQSNIAGFQSDDDLGLYIQTRLRPVAGDPGNLSPDNTTGIPNYLHIRFSDENSDIDIGSPLVSLHNQRFWRLHGRIDNRWTAFRTAKGLSENEPAYQQALAAAAHHMEEHIHGPHASSVTKSADLIKSVPEIGRHSFRFVSKLSEE